MNTDDTNPHPEPGGRSATDFARWNATSHRTAYEADRHVGSAGWRFVPAPEWPTPPRNWRPRYGWRPDPTWTTPTDWRWMRRTRGRITLIALTPLLIALPFPAFGGLIALEATAEANGRSIDPTDPANYDRFDLTNTTSQTLYVRRCSDPDCTSLYEHDTRWHPIEPSRSFREDIYWGPTTPTSFAVTTNNNDTTATNCVHLDAHLKTPVGTAEPVDLTNTTPCGE